MTVKNKLLIATANKGKLEEIKQFFADTPFDILGLDDLGETIVEPEENQDTIEGNAILKARYYGAKTGLISISDDGGLFINALSGWPGINSARVAKSDAERVATVLKKIKNKQDRTAFFKVTLAVYDPSREEIFTATGKTEGIILEEPCKDGINNFGYNPIFLVKDINKVYAHMSLAEKNAVSHRGQALNRVKYYLRAQYSPKDIVVPIALIVKEGKILSTLRNDPHRPDYHQKWEFPGGGMECGENIAENIIRETKEETGYDIEIVEMLDYIHVEYQADMRYQVYLIPHVCRIIGGDGQYSDNEVLELTFLSVAELMERELIGANKDMLRAITPKLNKIILNHNL